MNMRDIPWLAVLAVTLLIDCPVFAQKSGKTATPPSEQRVALVIGNSAYKDSPLANPVNDAADMARALENAGFKVILKRNANTRDMRQAIREFANELRRAQVGLFYFAGHGVQIKGANYLIPVGADIQSEADAEDLSVDANFVLRTMEDAQTKVSIVILDACRNNPYARSFRSTSRGLAQMTAATGSIVAFATAPGSVAADGTGRNGIYTKHLLASLSQPDTDILRVFQRTRAAVVKVTGGKQTPWESTSLIGDFYFRPPVGGSQAAGGIATTPETDPATVEFAFWESVKNSKSADEINAYLEQYPNGKFSGLARARLKSLQSPPQQVVLAPPLTAATHPPATPGELAGLRPGTSFKDCDVCPDMVVIPAGSFTMGSPLSEPERDADEGPQHIVTISRQFAAGKYEVTFDEWDACVREGGCNDRPDSLRWGRGRLPVIGVNWNDAKKYVNWLSRKTGKRYRLLTEAEWEYVARAGTTTAFSFGTSINPTHANYSTNRSYAGSPTAPSRGRTTPVGSYVPNAWGLYDVHGNVWEWTEDCKTTPDYNGAPIDGSAWTAEECGWRIVRGGSWDVFPRDLRSANRSGNLPNNSEVFTYGLRVARTD